MDELDRALSTVLTATDKLKELTKNYHDNTGQEYSGEGLFMVKAKCLARYQKSLLKIISTKSKRESLAAVEDEVMNTCKQRTILERIRPLELKLQPKIDKMLKVQEDRKSGGVNLKDLEDSSDENDEVENKSNENIDSDEEIDSEIESDNEYGEKSTEKSEKLKKYVPPKLNSVPYPGEFEPESADKKLERQEAARKRALKSSQLEALEYFYGDKPIVHQDDKTKQTAEMSKIIRQKEDRRKVEEENYKRIGITKKQKKAEERALTKDDMEAIHVMGDISMLDGELAKKYAMNKKKGGKKRSKYGSGNVGDIVFKSKKKRRH